MTTSSDAEPRLITSAAALVIGDELLGGKVQEANLLPLARSLWGLGIKLGRASFTTDEPAAIAAELNLLRAKYDLVVTSGGVGPTHDDRTYAAVAEAFGVGLAPHPELKRLIEAAYDGQVTDAHLTMAMLPVGARLFYAPDNRWPAVVVDNVWVLPGIPEVFRAKLPILEKHVRGEGRFYSASYACPYEESLIKDALDTVVERFADVAIGSYPLWMNETVKTNVTFDANDRARVDAAQALFEQLLADLKTHQTK